jgi:hypothetical protein
VRIAQCHVNQIDGSFATHQSATDCQLSSTQRVWT